MRRHRGVTVAALLILAAAVFVLATGMRPEFDVYGWLVWGRQTLHWNLDTNGAPSWKPLTYLFTLPNALAGRGQPLLWMITSVAGSFLGAVLAARIAYRLAGPAPGRRYAPLIAAVFAGLGLLTLDGYWRLILISNSDPMVVTLFLAAIDCHLWGRRRLAFLALLGASYGRPEAWPFAALYAAWTWRAQPQMRLLTIAGLLSVPLLWFTIPALTSDSWFRPGDLALNSVNALHGDKLTGVFDRFFGLYALPMKLAVGFAVVVAVVRRDRIWLGLIAASLAWIFIEVGFALYGWSAVPRYLIEPGSVMIVLAGAALGRVLAGAPEAGTALRWAAPIAIGALAVGFVPTARGRAREFRDEVINRRHAGMQIDRLHEVIDRDGGAARVRACGQPVTVLGFQSSLAWELGMNVGDVGFRPGRAVHLGQPVVVFKPRTSAGRSCPFTTRRRGRRSAHSWRLRPKSLSPRPAARLSAGHARARRRSGAWRRAPGSSSCLRSSHPPWERPRRVGAQAAGRGCRWHLRSAGHDAPRRRRR